jgi:hypothetical protein
MHGPTVLVALAERPRRLRSLEHLAQLVAFEHLLFLEQRRQL